MEDIDVEFRLLYRGMLYSKRTVANKFLIRRQLHPQLRRLWSEHPVLRDECERIGAQCMPPHPDANFRTGIEQIANTRVNGFTFLPLVREGLFVRCSLDVLFLRRERPGRIWIHGDIDNRLKTLFDALRMPNSGQEIGGEVPGQDEEPFYVLLQEDDAIADVSVTTDRLLEVPFENQYDREYTVLVINVKLQATQRGEWWHVFS